MKNKQLQIRLEYKKSILYETASAEIDGTISIGRAGDCKWIIPAGDALASGHHAAITLKKNRPCICDAGSRNGIFIKGQRISERILQQGDVISIGDCLLIVEESESKTENRAHTLQLMTGPEAGKQFVLENRRYVIGSSPACDIPMMNQLVSQKHAELDVRSDGCWITDSGSKNGTLINGTALKPGTERLLKDSDIVSIAHFDLKFLDRSIRHSQSRLLHSALVVALTAIVVFAGYYTYIHLNPSALDLISRARSAAAQRDFDLAEKLLADSATARNAEECRLRGADLARDIGTWRETIRQWRNAQDFLSASRWTDAAYTLGAIDASRMELWNWNDSDAVESRKQAALSKELLDSFLNARTAAAGDHFSFDDLRGRAERLSALLTSSGKQKLNFLEPLNKEAAALVGNLNAGIAANDKIETILAKLKESPVQYDSVIAELESVARNSHAAIRTRAEKLVLPIIALRKSAGLLKETSDTICDMNFKKAADLQLHLPPLEQCAVNPHIANLRREQADTAGMLVSTAQQLAHLYAALQQYGVSIKQEIPPQIACFSDSGIMDRVLACDLLEKPLPARARSAPAGEYDRILGMEPFYDFLYSLPLELDTAIYDDIGFQVEILRAYHTFRRLENFSRFMAMPKNSVFLAGKLGDFNRFAAGLLKKRSELTAGFAGQPNDTRPGLIARGIALFLAGKGDLPENAPEQYMAALKKYRAELVKLDAEFSNALPERAIEIRDEILQRGIPGDPLVRKMWAKRR